MANRFWVGGTGTWDNVSTAHWSTSSGGSAGASVPQRTDTAVFDSNSGGGTVTVTARLAEKVTTKTGFAGSHVLAAPHSFQHMSGPRASEITRQLNATSSADLLSRGGWPGPVAIEIARQMHSGIGNVEYLRGMGFSAPDALELAAQINLAGAR
jgi:hypothetical protein